MRGGARPATAAALVGALLAAAPALAAFPGPEPPPDAFPESPRANTPNDPQFDPCEPDDAEPPAEENTDEPACGSYFSEQFNLFGFRPESAKDLLGQPLTYRSCDQLDAQGRDANVKAGDPECSQISGVRADSAWKYSTGDPDVVVAILDTGMRWQAPELIEKVHLNTDELPRPQGSGAYDANGDGKVSVGDWAADPRVSRSGGDTESDAVLDASDLIAAFSDGTDADRNGYVDDIAGWDFFDDDNDPFDASSCCNAGGHGTGRAEEAARATHDGRGGAGLCPRCQIMPLRVWDTFVVDTNLYAMGVVYAADNGASVVEGAVGGLLNTSFARRAFAYADSKGLALTMVSSDINSANHNYPTNYNEAIYVAGSMPDSAPGLDCRTPGFPGAGQEDIPGCKEFLDLLTGVTGIKPSAQPPTTSFFRNSNLTQYGGKADIVLMGSTGSQNTGQAAGAAGLLVSYARQEHGIRLTGNEVRQLLTMTAEDVLPENTGSIGLPDKANRGWDPHFGYGRVNLAGAMRRVQRRGIPPEVQIDAPDWFAPINVERTAAAGVPVRGRVGSRRFDGPVTWELSYACGQDAVDGRDFKVVSRGEGDARGELGRLSRGLLEQLADGCDGSVRNDAGRPAGNLRQGNAWPADPYPEPDPERHAFQVRLTAREKDDPANVGEYRKTLFAYRDDGTLRGWPKPLGPGADPGILVTGSGGEVSPRLADLDADNRLDLILPSSSGEVHVAGPDGSPLRSWNGGEPVRTGTYAVARRHGTGGAGEAPREAPRMPAVGDVTGDGEPEVVLTAGEHLYAWHRDGRRVRGFPRRIDPDRSQPCVAGVQKPCFDVGKRFITTERHIKRGFLGSPALADLDEDGRLDVVAGSLDQHVYAWDGRGRALPGFPARLDSDKPSNGAEIVASPAIADLDGDRDPEVVIATNEVIRPEGGDFDLEDLFSIFTARATGANPVYALHGDGKPVAGWPVHIGVLAGDVLPLVLPSNDAAVGDLAPDRKGDEVAVSAATGTAKLVAGDGDVLRTFSSQPPPPPLSGLTDASTQLNLADYPSIGRLSDAAGPSVIKGGFSLLGAANLVAVNQNLPFNHAVQAWEPRSGAYRSGWPVATDDFQLLSQPVVAKLDGSGAGRQALVGTGLYQLHAYGQDGSEPPGWPKFTGGWIFATPSVGDLDGDGRLDVVTVTREGWAFAWTTAAPACRAGSTATNAEWWTFHHDEHGTANYGHDARPPSRPGRVSAAKLANGDLRLRFAGSGDDLQCGTAERYEVAGSSRPIRSGAQFVRARRLETRSAAASQAGRSVSLIARGGARHRHVAVRAVDDAGNRSYVSPERGKRRKAAARRGRGKPTATAAGRGARGGDAGSLPFTGLALGALLLIALLLLALGRALRRATD